MTSSVTLTTSRLLAVMNGITRFDSNDPMLQWVFRTGSVVLPTYTAGNSSPVDRTDTYELSTVAAQCNVVLGMWKLIPTQPSQFAQNSDIWSTYNGETPYTIWSHYITYSPTGGLSNLGYSEDFIHLSSICTFRFYTSAGKLYLADRLKIYAPYDYAGNPGFFQRSRYQATLQYRLYCGFFV
jgi:hypothetical protein